MNIINLGEFSGPNALNDAIKGTWGKDWGELYRLSILKNVGVFSTDVITSATTPISCKLPAHYPFHLVITSVSGVKCILVTDDISITLTSGEQASGIFMTKI